MTRSSLCEIRSELIKLYSVSIHCGPIAIGDGRCSSETTLVGTGPARYAVPSSRRSPPALRVHGLARLRPYSIRRAGAEEIRQALDIARATRLNSRERCHLSTDLVHVRVTEVDERFIRFTLTLVDPSASMCLDEAFLLELFGLGNDREPDVIGGPPLRPAALQKTRRKIVDREPEKIGAPCRADRRHRLRLRRLRVGRPHRAATPRDTLDYLRRASLRRRRRSGVPHVADDRGADEGAKRGRAGGRRTAVGNFLWTCAAEVVVLHETQ